MESILNEQDNWKSDLRSDIIRSVSDGALDRSCFNRIGYAYMYYAPKYLYKYYDDSSLKLQTVKNNKMWFSAPCNFNDVFDSDIVIDEESIFQSALKMIPDPRGIRKGSPVWQAIRQKVSQEVQKGRKALDGLKETTGITCLSESSESLLMWSHYANNHKGICVEYDLLEINGELKFTPVPVLYVKDRVIYMPQTLDRNAAKSDAMALLVNSLTSKSPEWEYEKEWRIIRDKKACGDRWDENNRGALLDMISPNAIILGCMANAEYEKDIQDYCISTRTNLFRMEKDSTKYRLNKVPVLEFD